MRNYLYTQRQSTYRIPKKRIKKTIKHTFNTMKTFYIICLLLACQSIITGLSAQTVSGKLVDEKTNRCHTPM